MKGSPKKKRIYIYFFFFGENISVWENISFSYVDKASEDSNCFKILKNDLTSYGKFSLNLEMKNFIPK